ncbi:hypothetical protein FEZ32_00540 [Acidipropionibacterium jensenii]|uniref:hypothetical protein n=1 Tax=Acidipropionibacterium jensenii TaxID=1749 RepID=UPI00110B536C|nr:hypothetical protein [Acidipropionibacterium jensenii]QCV87054.1 hypothetical protein FEZ32_00540 [Acidipropionibacterium jensenii]
MAAMTATADTQTLWGQIQRSRHGYPCGRNELPRLLFGHFQELMQAGELRAALEDTWSLCEWPGRAADTTSWLALWGLAGADHTPVTGPIWRAAAEVYADGLSWTTDRNIAVRFHDRNLKRFPTMPGRCGLWRIDHPESSHVLAVLDDASHRNEHEIVYSPQVDELVREL